MGMYNPKRYNPRDEKIEKREKSGKRDTENQNKERMTASHSSPTCKPGGQKRHEIGTPARHTKTTP
jgi:hypothetical protein